MGSEWIGLGMEMNEPTSQPTFLPSIHPIPLPLPSSSVLSLPQKLPVKNGGRGVLSSSRATSHIQFIHQYVLDGWKNKNNNNQRTSKQNKHTSYIQPCLSRFDSEHNTHTSYICSRYRREHTHLLLLLSLNGTNNKRTLPSHPSICTLCVFVKKRG